MKQQASSAAALAERIERFCSRGIDKLASGGCEEPGISPRRHRRAGHDAGCRTLGVPRRAILLTLTMWDRAGAAHLLMEAVDEAIETLTEAQAEPGSGGAQSPAFARECLAYAIRIRITPRMAEHQPP